MIRYTLSKADRKTWMDAESEEDADLSFLLGNGWKILRFEKILTDSLLMAFLDANGPTTVNDIYAHFKSSDYPAGAVDVAIANLANTGHIKSMRAKSAIHGVYVSKKHQERQQEEIAGLTRGSEPIPFLVEEDVTVVDESVKADIETKEVPTITKAEGKRQRALIISKATSEDLLGTGIKASFWDNMPAEAYAYWQSLDNFKQKLVVTEIKKLVAS